MQSRKTSSEGRNRERERKKSPFRKGGGKLPGTLVKQGEKGEERGEKTRGLRREDRRHRLINYQTTKKIEMERGRGGVEKEEGRQRSHYRVFYKELFPPLAKRKVSFERKLRDRSRRERVEGLPINESAPSWVRHALRGMLSFKWKGSSFPAAKGEGKNVKRALRERSPLTDIRLGATFIGGEKGRGFKY